ncbi:MAG: Ig-like domain-containing protein [Acidobacteriota bacterium]
MKERLFRCSVFLCFLGASLSQAAPPTVRTGIPNVQQTPGALLSELMAPGQGRTAILAYHNGILYTVPEQPSSQSGSDFLVRTWDLLDVAGPPGSNDPVLLGTHGVTPQPINAHGYFKSGDYLVLGSNWPPESPWSFRYDSPTSTTRTAFPDLLCAGTRGCLFQPWFVGDTYWSYGDVSGNATISRNWNEFANWDHLGLTGVIGHPFLLGDLLIFASDQSRTGVATYDVSDPSNPVLLDVLSAGGAGGYWPELWGGDGKLYIVFPYRTGGNGMRVVDATDPSDLRFLADTPLPGDASMYIQFQDEFAFMGSHKVDMRTFQSVLRFDDGPYAGVSVDTSQFLLPLGNLLVTGGIGANQGMAVWAHQAAPDTRGPSVGFHIPQSGRTGYPVGAPISLLIHETLETPTIVNGDTFLVRPLGGSAIAGQLTYSFNDVLTFTPDSDLQQNTTYEVVVTAGGIKDAAGNGMVGYSFTFSTGASVGGNQAPSIESLDVSDYPAEPGGNVTLSLSATDPEGGSLQYRFDFGDGSAKTAWSSSSTGVANYATAGHFRATGQVRDASGSIASTSVTVTVAEALPAHLPSSSSPIACQGATRRVWTVNPDNDTVTALHADTGNVLLEVPVCKDPRSVAVAGGEVWVSCFDEDEIAVLDEASGGELVRLQLGYGSGPQGLLFSPNGQTAYVALESRGEVLRLDRSSRTETGRTFLGPTPRALAITGDGSRLLVTRFLSPEFRGEVWELNASSLSLVRTLDIPKFGGDQHRDTTADGRGVANELAAVSIDPYGDFAWVAAKKVNVDGGTLNGEDIDQDNTVRNLLVLIDLQSGDVVRAHDVDNSASSSAVAFSPLGDYAFVALQGNGEVLVLDALLDPATTLGGLVTRIAVERAPQGLCADASSESLFVKNFLSRSVSIADLSGLLQNGASTVPTEVVTTVGNERLSAQVLRGKQLFYDAGDPRMSAEGYLSCATCHLDGAHDGRVWDFTSRGEGLRNTTTLRGRGGTLQGNVHWSANFDEIHDFENDIRGPFGGQGFLSNSDFAATENPLGTPKAGLSPDLDALAAYVTSLGHQSVPRSPYRNGDGTLTVSASRGAASFAALGCNSCHGGSELTDSTLGTATLHDVGTLRSSSGSRLGQSLSGIDTPSLLGVWNGAPYLHDGSAKSLEDVFRMTGGVNLQLENGSLSNGASPSGQYVDLNNDSTPRGLAFVDLGSAGATVTLSGVDGGSGGQGAVELRYSSGYGATPIDIVVNGVTHAVVAPEPGNVPQWRHVNWDRVRVEGVDLNAGSSNTVRVRSPTGSNFSADEIVVSTAEDLAAASAHRAALSLSGGDRSDLIQYLLQLDAQGDGLGVPELLRDGFESGDLSAWSSEVP